MSTCSIVCGWIPSLAATTSNTASIRSSRNHRAHEAFVAGMSIKSISVFPACMRAKPSAIDIPRRFSSASLSVSSPLSASPARLAVIDVPDQPSTRCLASARSERRLGCCVVYQISL